jgi:hypothetical protein
VVIDWLRPPSPNQVQIYPYRVLREGKGKYHVFNVNNV